MTARVLRKLAAFGVVALGAIAFVKLAGASDASGLGLAGLFVLLLIPSTGLGFLVDTGLLWSGRHRT